jgi:hypothetical protein
MGEARAHSRENDVMIEHTAVFAAGAFANRGAFTVGVARTGGEVA